MPGCFAFVYHLLPALSHWFNASTEAVRGAGCGAGSVEESPAANMDGEPATQPPPSPPGMTEEAELDCSMNMEDCLPGGFSDDDDAGGQPEVHA